MRLHPDFSHPGKQPLGPVEIDRSNPLTRGLKRVLFRDRACPVSGVVYDFTAPIAYKDADSLKIQSSGHIDMSEGVGFFGTEWTLTAIVKRDSAGGDAFQAVMTHRGGDVGSNGGFWIRSADIHWRIGSGAGIDGTVSVGVYHTVSLASTALASNSNKLWLDGSELSGSLGGTLTDNATPDFFVGALANLPNNDKLVGNVKIAMYHDRQLSDWELSSLHSDPYQIFKPAIPTPIIAPAGGTTTISAALATRTRTTHAATITRAYNITANLATRTRTTYPATITQPAAITANLATRTRTTYPATITSGVIAAGGTGEDSASRRAAARRRARLENARLEEEEARLERERLEAEEKALARQIGKLKKRTERARKAELKAQREKVVAQAVEARLRQELAAQRLARANREREDDEIAILLLMA